MKVMSFKSRNDVLNYFSQSAPIVESDYYITIDSPLVGSVPNKIPIKSFTFPDSPIQYSSSEEHSGNVEGMIRYGGQIAVSYYSTGEDTIFEKIWMTQFSSAGAPTFIPKIFRPIITISRRKDDKILFRMRGCKITYPKPSVNLAGSGASEYIVNVTYNDVTIV